MKSISSEINPAEYEHNKKVLGLGISPFGLRINTRENSYWIFQSNTSKNLEIPRPFSPSLLLRNPNSPSIMLRSETTDLNTASIPSSAKPIELQLEQASQDHSGDED